jgi:hypothetical protein
MWIGRGVAVAALLVTAVGPTAAQAAEPEPVARGGPSAWSKISTGTSGITFQASLQRTADGVLHVLYPQAVGAGDGQLAHTEIGVTGETIDQGEALASSWSIMDTGPVLIRDGDGLRAVFGGIMTTSPGFWSDGRVYTATADASGSAWTLPAEGVGVSHSGYGSYGTAAVELADGTPVAAFPVNSTITWHVGTGNDPDQSFDVGLCCAYDMAMARDGDDVWIAWYANGGTAATNGTFVRQILPTLGPITKAPQSSVGASSVSIGRVALTSRPGGGVFAAYCTSYPYCGKIGLWRVGSDHLTKVPGSQYADNVAISSGPAGRIWLAWSDNIPRVRVVRTSTSGLRIGPARSVDRPASSDSVYSVAIDGTTGRGDVVINAGNGFWHTQVQAGLSLAASPTSWKHGKAQKVTFTVTDAGDPVAGAAVKAGGHRCTAAANGKCSITFSKKTKKGKIQARASALDYAAGGRVLTVK